MEQDVGHGGEGYEVCEWMCGVLVAEDGWQGPRGRFRGVLIGTMLANGDKYVVSDMTDVGSGTCGSLLAAITFLSATTMV